MEFAVITDAYDWHVMRASATPEAPVWVPSNPGGIPTPEQLVEFELIVVVGSLSETGTALQLAGVVKLAMERGKGTCVFAHPPHLSEHDAHFVEAMGLPIPYGNRADHVKRYPDEFHAYFTEYGMSGSAYNSTDTAEAIRLGWIYDNEGMLEPQHSAGKQRRRVSSTQCRTTWPNPGTPLAWSAHSVRQSPRTATRFQRACPAIYPTSESVRSSLRA